MKAPIFSAYAKTPKHMAAVVQVLREDAEQHEQPSADEQRYPSLFALARAPFDINVVYDEQPNNHND